MIIERPDGSQVTVVVNISPLKNELEEVTGVINCFYDVSERKQADQKLQSWRFDIAAYLRRRTMASSSST